MAADIEAAPVVDRLHVGDRRHGWRRHPHRKVGRCRRTQGNSGCDGQRKATNERTQHHLNLQPRLVFDASAPRHLGKPPGSAEHWVGCAAKRRTTSEKAWLAAGEKMTLIC